MGHFVAEIYEADYYEVETRYEGTVFIDASWVGTNPTIDDLKDYIGCSGVYLDEYTDHVPSGRARYWLKRAETAGSHRKMAKYLANAKRYEELDPWEEVLVPLERKHGWLAHLTAPGYLDQTDLCAYSSYEEAKDALLEMYGSNDDGPREDWEKDLHDEDEE